LYACTGEDTTSRGVIRIPLKDQALSVSASRGRFFEDAGETLGHIIDPRTGAPVKAASIAAVVLASATESDALSTALLTLGFEGHNQIARCRPGIRSLVGMGSGASFRAVSQGIPLEALQSEGT
jgi:thiamine biosynthesis lipoprotein